MNDDRIAMNELVNAILASHITSVRGDDINMINVWAALHCFHLPMHQIIVW